VSCVGVGDVAPPFFLRHPSEGHVMKCYFPHSTMELELGSMCSGCTGGFFLILWAYTLDCRVVQEVFSRSFVPVRLDAYVLRWFISFTSNIFIGSTRIWAEVIAPYLGLFLCIHPKPRHVTAPRSKISSMRSFVDPLTLESSRIYLHNGIGVYRWFWCW